jgi:hypothetical protein
LLPKGQQKLTKFSDLIEEGLSYLQLFLELPETVWSLQNRSYIPRLIFIIARRLGSTKDDLFHT